jgi:glyoxylase-like metal-dependent hydrolase (beta-lactamase superfamily II)
MRVGDVDVLSLLDATLEYPWPLGELFPHVPAEAWEPFRVRYPEAFGAGDAWRSCYHCYLLRTPEQTILVDTGMGPTDTPLGQAFGVAGQLPERLRAAGLEPQDIDTVVLTHLHPDHVGGALRRDGEDVQLAFARARYLASEVDWDTFHRPEIQAHFPFAFVEQTITPIQTQGTLELVGPDGVAVSDEVRLVPAPGHTPGHLIVDVASRGEHAILLIDALLHPAQVTEPDWVAMFDMDPEQDRRTRRELLDRLESESLPCAVSHFPHPSFGRIGREDGRRVWIPTP